MLVRVPMPPWALNPHEAGAPPGADFATSSTSDPYPSRERPAMKILHTADWHLGARLGRVDRADDLRRAVGQVFGHCEREAVDVLLSRATCSTSIAAPTTPVRRSVTSRRPPARSCGRGDGPGADRQPRRRDRLHDAPAHPVPGRSPARRTSAASGRRGGSTSPPGRPSADWQTARGRGPVRPDAVPDAPAATSTNSMARRPAMSRGTGSCLTGSREALAKMRAHSRFRSDLHSVLVAHLYLAGVDSRRAAT